MGYSHSIRRCIYAPVTCSGWPVIALINITRSHCNNPAADHLTAYNLALRQYLDAVFGVANTADALFGVASIRNKLYLYSIAFYLLLYYAPTA